MSSFNWHARFSQQARWTATLRRYVLDQARLGPSARILEVGCGTGAVLAALAEETAQAGAGKVEQAVGSLEALPLPGGRTGKQGRPGLYGLDINRAFLQQAAQNAASTRLVQGNAYQIPYPTGSFDLVVCHYLMLWLREPAAALSEMHRVARPGGWVCVLAEPDYGGRIDYPPALDVLGQLQRQALRQQGADPEVGRKLAGLFHQAGLGPVESGVLGGQWVGIPPAEERAQEWAVLADDLAGILPEGQLAQLHILEEQAWQAGQRTLFVPTFYILGRK